jgi:hypothetical protein
MRQIAKLRNLMRKALQAKAKEIAAAVVAAYAKVGKVEDPNSKKARQILSAIKLEGFSIYIGQIAELLQAMGKDGARLAFIQLGSIPDDQSIVNTADETTIEWSKARAAELVGMKYTKSGKLITNPNAKWAITDATRESLQSLVTNAIENGWSTDRLGTEIKGSYAFSDARADMIARTEIKRADVQGSLEAYKASGVVKGKQSLLSSDYDNDDECSANADDGVIPLEQAFSSGDDAPPYHPNCRCVLVPADINEGD